MSLLDDHVKSDLPVVRPSPADRLGGFLHRYGSHVIVLLLALAAFATRAYNLGQYPGLYIDEGFYVSQAWSFATQGELAPYTYWFDHSPLGWILTGAWFVLSGALFRHDDLSVMAGREFMVVCAMATAVLLFVLARRLGANRFFAALTSLLWILSPLAISFSRLVLLDNIAVPWILGAMVLALSPSRRLLSIAAAGVCFAAACLVKETALLTIVGFAVIAWQNFRGSGNRKVAQLTLWSVFTLVCALYPLFALLKNELFPGPGHVSLIEGQILYQLADRGGSGNVLDPGSLAHGTVFTGWLPLDYWLPSAGLVAMLPALFFRKLRGPALALGVQIAMFLRTGGYIPFPMIIMLMPFFALLVGGLLGVLWPYRERLRAKGWRRYVAVAGVVVVLAVPAGFVIGGGLGQWLNTYRYEATARQTQPQRDVVQWGVQNLRPDDIIVVESEIWLDFISAAGLPQQNVVMTYKLDADPEVVEAIGDPKQAVTYVIVKRDTLKDDERAKSYPTVLELARTSQVVATFGPPNDDSEWLIFKMPAATTPS